MNVETSTEEREANERTILLVDQDRRDSEYGSDGESPVISGRFGAANVNIT
jgi:hypothetical protein